MSRFRWSVFAICIVFSSLMLAQDSGDVFSTNGSDSAQAPGDVFSTNPSDGSDVFSNNPGGSGSSPGPGTQGGRRTSGVPCNKMYAPSTARFACFGQNGELLSQYQVQPVAPPNFPWLASVVRNMPRYTIFDAKQALPRVYPGSLTITLLDSPASAFYARSRGCAGTPASCQSTGGFAFNLVLAGSGCTEAKAVVRRPDLDFVCNEAPPSPFTPNSNTPQNITPRSGPCVHKSLVGRPLQIGNAQDWYRLVKDLYGTGRPIEIIKITNYPNAYVVVLTGTEFGTRQSPGNQANMVNLSNATTGVHHLLDDVAQLIAQVMTRRLVQAAQTFGDLMGNVVSQPKLLDYLLNKADPDMRAARGMTTMYQVRVIQAMKAAHVPSNANLILVGHSLGGMDVEILPDNSQFARLYPYTRRVITFGSPVINEDHPNIRYLRFASPTDLVPYLAPRSLSTDRSKWILVNNPGQNPRLPLTLDWNAQLTAIGQGVANSHLNYDLSDDLAKYDPLTGAKQITTKIILDPNDDHCYEAPDNNDSTGVAAAGTIFSK